REREADRQTDRLREIDDACECVCLYGFYFTLPLQGYLTPLYSHVLASGGSSNFIKTVFSNIIKIHQLHM
ncbi:MAG: hypothetical protein MJE68_28715, partial [Proteobacteria bacterium]|nr:hypothetical protein [Pseudomonadota bacterium]